jgi:hypothetical protein
MWNDSVLRMISAKASVGYAHLAVRLLLCAGHVSPLCSNIMSRNAIEYHGIALRHVLVDSINQGDLLSTLLCSMFFIVFELLQGDIGTAQMHVHHACQLMNNLSARSGPEDSEDPEIISVEDRLFEELQRLIGFLELQFENKLPLYVQVPPPGLENVEGLQED